MLHACLLFHVINDMIYSHKILFFSLSNSTCGGRKIVHNEKDKQVIDGLNQTSKSAGMNYNLRTNYNLKKSVLIISSKETKKKLT